MSRASRPSGHASLDQTFADRAAIKGTPPVNAYLLRLMVAKETNLCLSADVQTTSQLLELANECGDAICVLKTHADIIKDFGERTIKGLTEIAARKRFLIFEDRKFGDIGNTVQMQYAAGPHCIASWAPITNAHVFPGPAIVTALRSAAMSALSAYNTSRTTEITGGVTDGYFSHSSGSSSVKTPTTVGKRSKLSGPNLIDDAPDEDADGDDEDDDDEDYEDDEGRNSPHSRDAALRSVDADDEAYDDGIPQCPPELVDRRKASVVSVSTTISSSTEFISPPATAERKGPFDPATLGSPPLGRGLLLLAQMSSANNLLTPAYTDAALEMARSQKDFVLGFIAQETLNRDPDDNFVVMTPGVSLPSAGTERKGDNLGQQYNTPRHVILEKGVDIIIVGRGILEAEDREAEAERYRKEAWSAYLERVGAKQPLPIRQSAGPSSRKR